MILKHKKLLTNTSKKGFSHRPMKYVPVPNRIISILPLGMRVPSYCLHFPNAASSYWFARLFPSGREGNKKSQN